MIENFIFRPRLHKPDRQYIILSFSKILLKIDLSCGKPYPIPKDEIRHKWRLCSDGNYLKRFPNSIKDNKIERFRRQYILLTFCSGHRATASGRCFLPTIDVKESTARSVLGRVTVGIISQLSITVGLLAR